MTPPPRDEAVTRAEFAKFAVSEACPMRFHAPDVDSWLDGNDRMAVIDDRYRWWLAGRSSILTRVEAAEGAVEAAYREGYAEGYSDRGRHGDGAADLEAWTNSAARDALRASGTREGAP